MPATTNPMTMMHATTKPTLSSYSSSPSDWQKWQITLFSALIFLLVVNPYTYKLTQALLGKFIGTISAGGCPTAFGLLLHTVVYILLVRYSMELNLFK
jgi:hypothetical protein